ncbi:MAG TPA: hypothetical protein VE175_01935 [Woeseiaceae bacterium]|jgi:hypothetical protein|nr:hypothetical protein [Woeseiaceae bacterium]
MPVALTVSCHCGAVRIDMRRKPRSLTSCNCSICRRYGALWAYFTRKSVNYDYAPDAVKAYVWGNETIEFFHCARCGCVTHYERTAKKGDDTRVGINVRNADPAAVASLRIRKLDGASAWKSVRKWRHGWA